MLLLLVLLLPTEIDYLSPWEEGRIYRFFKKRFIFSKAFEMKKEAIWAFSKDFGFFDSPSNPGELAIAVRLLSR